jgi:transcriptional regulator with XRE-family HTH domain
LSITKDCGEPNVQARLDKGMTQTEVAKLLKRPQSYVSKYELGERRLDVVELIEIAEVLGVAAEQLVAEITAA